MYITNTNGFRRLFTLNFTQSELCIVNVAQEIAYARCIMVGMCLNGLRVGGPADYTYGVGVWVRYGGCIGRVRACYICASDC